MLRTLKRPSAWVALVALAAAACAGGMSANQAAPSMRANQVPPPFDPEWDHYDAATRTTTVPIRFLGSQQRILWADPVVVHPGEQLEWTASSTVCSDWTVRFDPDPNARGGGTPLAGNTTMRDKANPRARIAGSPGPGPIRRYKYDIECVRPGGADTVTVDPEVIVDPDDRGAG